MAVCSTYIPEGSRCCTHVSRVERVTGGAISTGTFVVVCGRSAMASEGSVGEAREMVVGVVVRVGFGETRWSAGIR